MLGHHNTTAEIIQAKAHRKIIGVLSYSEHAVERLIYADIPVLVNDASIHIANLYMMWKRGIYIVDQSDFFIQDVFNFLEAAKELSTYRQEKLKQIK